MLLLHGLERLLHFLHLLLLLLEHGAHLLLLGGLLLVAVGLGYSLPLFLVELLRKLVVQLQLDVDGVLERDLGRWRQRQRSQARTGAADRRGVLEARRTFAYEGLLGGRGGEKAVEQATAKGLLEELKLGPALLFVVLESDLGYGFLLCR